MYIRTWRSHLGMLMMSCGFQLRVRILNSGILNWTFSFIIHRVQQHFVLPSYVYSVLSVSNFKPLSSSKNDRQRQGQDAYK